jgi:hypothetical protein
VLRKPGKEFDEINDSNLCAVGAASTVGFLTSRQKGTSDRRSRPGTNATVAAVSLREGMEDIRRADLSGFSCWGQEG